MRPRKIAQWPVLKRYDQRHLLRIAMPIGGIGTGTISLGGRGDLRDWEIMNQPCKGFTPLYTFFSLYAKPSGGKAVTRALEGAIEPVEFQGSHGSIVPNHSLPRFRKCTFDAAYPLAGVNLSDADVPLDVRIEAFNPLIPGDADASGIPAVVLRFVLKNKTGKSVEASVCGNLQNFIGTDSIAGESKKNVNEFRDGLARGISMRSEGVDPANERWGTMALVTTATAGVTHRTAWANYGWGDALLDFWDDFSDDGKLEPREASSDVAAPFSSLAASVKVPPRGEKSVTFLIAWHFPNRVTWTPTKSEELVQLGKPPAFNAIGNYYTTRYTDAWDVATHTTAHLAELESGTVAFVRGFCDSNLPDVVKEAALFNLSTLRTQTTFRTADGMFYGWEGCGGFGPPMRDKGGCCIGSCTHVWNYEQTTPFVFGDLAKRMREIEFAHCTAANGMMSFRVELPLERAQKFPHAAADGQMGCLLKLHREWQLSGDDEMLRQLWPHARRALEFCWIPGGWDADRDGVMEGCQHNTMDVEYFGPNPEMGGWYLGALRAAEEMARHLGDTEFASTCHDLFTRGSTWMDANLFNGEYYEHEIRPPKAGATIAPGLSVGMGAKDMSDPALQLGAGCLADQLVGQLSARICGLGDVLDKRHVRTTLRSLMKYNFKVGVRDHFNHLRSYLLNDESGLLVATYPKGRRPKRPFPYCNEAWTGFEYTAAAHMLYEGQTADALRIIRAARDRHDGLRRNPFDEAECGHHYTRAMAAWATVLAFTGFRYSAVDQSIEFAPTKKASKVFWSNGYAWGTFSQKPKRGGGTWELSVMHGEVGLKRIKVGNTESVLKSPRPIRKGESLRSSETKPLA